MFTGIVQTTAPVIAIEKKNHFYTYYIRLPKPLLHDLTVGASISHNGCCLTVTNIIDDVFSVDLIKETLKLTNLGSINIGEEINIERAANLQTEIGGHLMSGHITCTAEITKIIKLKNNRQIWFTISKLELMKYIFYKGYIGIDGISLTIGKIINNRFCVNLIPETLRRTSLGNKRIGYNVNIEIDWQTKIIVDTVERILLVPKSDQSIFKRFVKNIV